MILKPIRGNAVHLRHNIYILINYHENKSVILLLFLAICGLTEAKAVANDEGANTSNFIYRERAIRICRCGNICLMASRAF